jgi:hypothetical protein
MEAENLITSLCSCIYSVLPLCRFLGSGTGLSRYEVVRYPIVWLLRKIAAARLREASILFLLRPDIEKNARNTAHDVQIADVPGLKPNGRTLPISVYDILLCVIPLYPAEFTGVAIETRGFQRLFRSFAEIGKLFSVAQRIHVGQRFFPGFHRFVEGVLDAAMLL